MENLTEIKSPTYRVESFSTSFEGERRDFITLHVRLRGKLLHIEISPSNFRNSPTMVEDFYKYLEVARSGLDALDNDIIYDLFDWATKPFLALFKNQGSGSGITSKVPGTMQDFLYPDTFDCEFGAVDDKFIPRNIQRQEIQEAQALSEFGDDFVHLQTQLQSTQPSKVEIHSEYPVDAPDLPDAEPHRVCVDGQMLFFKSAHMSSLRDTINAIKKYLRIAELGSDIRTSHLYGIVADDKSPLIGLLFYYLDSEDTLTFAVESSTPATLKHQWSTQITDTLMKLHKGGVVWGDAKPDNILIDKDRNAWIIDFEGGHTEGWVDRDKAGTMEGDLQGLEKIVNFIFEEKAIFDDSGDDEYGV